MGKLKQRIMALWNWLISTVGKRGNEMLVRLWNRLPLILGLAIAIIALRYILLALYTIEGTGIGEHTNPQGESVAAKTLWDWLDLLGVPLILAVVGYFINSTVRNTERDRAKQEAQTDREIADDRAKEQALQAYFDTMTELLLEHGLREKLKDGERDAPVVDIARVRTVTVLRKLNPDRKSEVLDFLRDAELYSGEHALLQNAIMNRIDLESAELMGLNLCKAKLEHANLKGAKLFNANLKGANLSSINLEGANLQIANLTDAILHDANLKGAILLAANLRGAILFLADLEGANLQKANLTNASLNQAILEGANLKGANLTDAILCQADLNGHTTLPDGTKWTPETDTTRFTNPNHPDYVYYKTNWDGEDAEEVGEG